MITQELLKRLFDYDAETGVLSWRAGLYRNRYAGMPAGCVGSNAHRKVKVCQEYYEEHRLIWMLVYGALPDSLDHINGNPTDNRLANLRKATPTQNAQNRKLRKDNSTGTSGVYWRTDSKKWRAGIGLGGKAMRWLGTFDSQEEAVAVRKLAEQEHFGEFARR